MKQSWRPPAIAALGLGAVVLASGTGAAAVAALGTSSSHDGQIGMSAPATTAFPPAASREAALLKVRTILDPMVSDLHLGVPEAGSDRTGTWMYATVRAPATAGQAVPGMWEAELAQGALGELLPGKDASDIGGTIVGSTIMLDTGSGTAEQIGGGTGDVAPGQNFRAQATHQTDAQITGSIDATLARFGLTSLGIRVLRPLGPAPSVVAQVADPATLAGRWAELLQALNNGDYEGLYLELLSRSGSVLVRSYSALRMGANGVWFAPGMDDLLGITHPHIPPASPPSDGTPPIATATPPAPTPSIS